MFSSRCRWLQINNFLCLSKIYCSVVVIKTVYSYSDNHAKSTLTKGDHVLRFSPLLVMQMFNSIQFNVLLVISLFLDVKSLHKNISKIQVHVLNRGFGASGFNIIGRKILLLFKNMLGSWLPSVRWKILYRKRTPFKITNGADKPKSKHCYTMSHFEVWWTPLL